VVLEEHDDGQTTIHFQGHARRGVRKRLIRHGER
jgi:hypothetical protein